LQREPIATVRRNHGLEHATVHILTADDPSLQVVGRADTKGFNIYGSISSKKLYAAAQHALKRLQDGESNLAIHPRCGTNLVVAGLLTALAAALAIGRKPRLDKLPNVILATTFAAFIAQPLGLSLQQHVTTSPDARGARITGIQERDWGKVHGQHVDIEWDE
jgi:hypothetical protein